MQIYSAFLAMRRIFDRATDAGPNLSAHGKLQHRSCGRVFSMAQYGLILVCGTWLSGCSSVQSYKPSEHGQKASLKITHDIPSLPDSSLSSYLFEDAEKCIQRLSVGKPLKNGDFDAVMIDADRKQTLSLVISFRSSSGAYVCRAATTFFAEADQAYTASLSMMGPYCLATILRKSGDELKLAEQEPRQLYSNVWTSKSPQCQ
ncbi:MAG: hypothetical protein RLY71_3753 [Pseudomonadota bacterium]|jgi:hypothetical protein